MNTKTSYKNRLMHLIGLMAAFVIIACSSGGGDSNNSNLGERSNDPDGTSPTAFSGAIEGFGSVIVNGIHFNTDSAAIETEDDSTASLEDLKIGMVVLIEGRLDPDGRNGSAQRVYFEDNLEGPIESVTVSDTGQVKTLQIMGVSVIVERGATAFDDGDPSFNFDSLDLSSVGNIVEVSGFSESAGTLRASFIQRKAEDEETFLSSPDARYEVKGTIANLDPAAKTFQLGNLTVDYANAVLDDHGSDGTTPAVLADGMPVEVKGRSLANGLLAAFSVEIKSHVFDDRDGDEVEMEGYLSNLNPTAEIFEIRGLAVDYATAQFRGGTRSDLSEGVRVEAEGLLSQGILLARKISFKSGIKLEARIDSYNGDNGTLTLAGLTGLLLHTDEMITRWEDDHRNSVPSPGEWVKIRATRSGTELLVTHLEREAADGADDLTIQGPAAAFDATSGTVTILGIDIDTSGMQNDAFEIEDQVIGREAFFAALAIGDLVKAKGMVNPTTGAVIWRAIEFEEADSPW